ETDDLAVLGIRGHAVPGCRGDGRRAGYDDGMEPLGHGAIRFLHLGDLREQVTFSVGLACGDLLLLDAVHHRRFFLVRESRVPLFGRGGFGGLLRVLHRSFTLNHDQAFAFWATFPCWRIRMALPKGSRAPMSVPQKWSVGS